VPYQQLSRLPLRGLSLELKPRRLGGQPDRTQFLAHRSGPRLTVLPPLPGTPRIHRRSARSPLRGGRPTVGRV